MLRTLAALFACSLATPAFADPSGMCPTDEHRALLRAWSHKLAEADDVDQAKDMAMKKLRTGERVFDLAEQIAPEAGGLAEARAKLDALEATVLAANTAAEVAGAFDSINSPDQKAITCHLDKMELIVVIIGLVLFIIPGIILLILLC